MCVCVCIYNTIFLISVRVFILSLLSIFLLLYMWIFLIIFFTFFTWYFYSGSYLFCVSYFIFCMCVCIYFPVFSQFFSLIFNLCRCNLETSHVVPIESRPVTMAAAWQFPGCSLSSHLLLPRPPWRFQHGVGKVRLWANSSGCSLKVTPGLFLVVCGATDGSPGVLRGE